MARVPYTPDFSAQPQSPGEGISVNTPSAAFGENIGAALRQLGSTTEQVGGELFQRAIALQDLQNEADARAAQTDYATKAAELHANYSSLEGKAAVDGLQGYLDSQRQLREQIRGSLKTPMAQRMYDSDTLPFMQRNVFSAAGHAADQNKNWVVGTAQASIDLTAKTFADPSNPKEFDAKAAKIDHEADTVAAAHGWEPGGVQEQNYKLKIKSNLRMGQITQVAQTDPQSALQMLGEHKGDMTEQDFERTTDLVRSRNRAVGTAVLANQVYNPDKTYKQMLDEGDAQVEKLANGDPLFKPDFERALRAKVQSDRYAANQDNQSNMNAIDKAIQSGTLNMQQLLTKPGVQEAYDALPPKLRESIPQRINTYNAAVNKETDENTLTYLRGLKSTSPEEFLNATTDITHLDGLSQTHQREVMGWRDQLTKDARADPRVQRALGWMRASHGSELQAMGIDLLRSGNQQEYYRYAGAMEGAIEAWTQDNKRPPSYEEIVDKIGPQIIRSVSTPGRFWGTNQTPFFDVVDTQLQAVKDEAVKRGVEPPNDNEIRRAYMSQMFQKLYGGSGGGDKPAPPRSQ